MPVRLPEATEALAWGVAEVIGHDITAVCVIEPETVIALIVHTREGAVQTAINHAITTQEALIRWLSTVFTRADWQPEALVVVGTGGDFGALMPRLEHALSVPVFAPAEAELALARGAALASATTTISTSPTTWITPASCPARPPLAGTGWAAGHAGSGRGDLRGLGVRRCQSANRAEQGHVAAPRPAAKTSPEAAAAVEPGATRRLHRDGDPGPTRRVSPAAGGTAGRRRPPPAELPAEPPLGAVDEPAAPIDAPAVEAPEAMPIDALPPEAPPTPVPPLPEQVAPPVAPVPAERPGILNRIRDRIHGIGRDDEVQQAPAPIPPPVVLPPGVPPEPPPP